MFEDVRGPLGRSAAALCLLGVVALTGCAVSSADLATGDAVAGPEIHGNVHGGAYPIQNATIRLMETQNNGYNGSAKQLDSATSDVNGNFNFTGTWTCDAGQYAYVTVSGGHTASNAENDQVVQVGVIGACSTDLANVGEAAKVNVFLSELSTVAAAYALGNFININNNKGTNSNPTPGMQMVNISAPANNNAGTPGCTGTGTNLTCKASGLGNAFANAYNLVDSVRYDGSFPTGAARSVTPNNSKGVVPQALINTLGNILQSCVDSPGGVASDGSHCGDLFKYATPPNGAAPTNTLQAALNIAAYPNNQVDNLFNLQPRAVFFTPDLSSDKLTGSTSTLMSYTMSIFYTGTQTGKAIGYPIDVALDEFDNAFVVSKQAATNSTYAQVDGFNPNGKGIFSVQYAGTFNPTNIVLDAATTPQMWVNDDSLGGSVFGLDSTSGGLNHVLSVTNGNPGALAIDSSNGVWVARDSSDNNQSLFRYDATNGYTQTTLSGVPKLGASTMRMQMDYKQNMVGVTSSTTTTASLWHFDYTSVGANTTPFSAALNAAGGYAVAVTNADYNYLPLNGRLDTGNGFTTGTLDVNGNSMGENTNASGTGVSYTTPLAAAVDGAGTIFWTDFEQTGQVFKLVPANSGSVSNGTLTSFLPCFVVSGQCSGGNSYLRGMAIDSSGAMWYVGDNANYAVVQTLGLAAPTWPLIEYVHAGVAVQ